MHLTSKLKKTYKFLLLVCIFFSLGLSTQKKISYIWQQFKYGTKLLINKKNTNQIHKDEKLSKYGEKIKIVEDIKVFASFYGLKSEGLYQTIVFPPDNPEVVSYLVVLCPPTSLTPIEFSFPLVGKVPYLGFFEIDQKTEFLKDHAKDNDVYLTEAGAFSLLGYIKDPIFPSMLKGNESSIASLFIHEITHSTIWIKNSAKFNEGLAEYISFILTEQYLIQHEFFDQLKNFRIKKHDYDLYFNWTNELKVKLNELYNDKTISKSAKLDKKNFIIQNAHNNKPNFKKYDFVGNIKNWNNAKIALTATYQYDFLQFENALNCTYKAQYEHKLRIFFDILIKNKSKLKGLSTEKILAKFCEIVKNKSNNQLSL